MSLYQHGIGTEITGHSNLLARREELQKAYGTEENPESRLVRPEP